MRLFRDEEHVRRAYEESGALFSPAQFFFFFKQKTAYEIFT